MSHKIKRKNDAPSRRFKFLVAVSLLIITLGLATVAYISLDMTARANAAATEAILNEATSEYYRCVATHVYSRTDSTLEMTIGEALATAGIEPVRLHAAYMINWCAEPVITSPTSLLLRLEVAPASVTDSGALGTDVVRVLRILENAGDAVQMLDRVTIEFVTPAEDAITVWQMPYQDALASLDTIDPAILFEAGQR